MICALGASLLYALASVLQQKSASEQSQEHSLRLGLLTRLVRQPVWLLGIVADAAGYVLQAIALWRGAIVVVQPLLVCGLLFVLPLGVKITGLKVTKRDWLGAVAVVAGLGAFLAIANPAQGHQNANLLGWIVVLCVAAVITGVLAGVGRRNPGRIRAITFSGAAGLVYGVAAGLTKSSAYYLSLGFGSLVTHWEPYMLLVTAAVGMVLSQSAFQAGSLDVSLPTMAAVDPIVSIVIGAAGFGEDIQLGAASGVSEAVALVVMVIGIYLLARIKVQAKAEDKPPRVI